MTRKKTSAKKAAVLRMAARKPKVATAFVVVREIPAETPTFTEPERVFASRADAQRVAAAHNRELRAMLNPFETLSPEYSVKGGEKALLARVKQLKLPVPKKHKSYNFIDWEEWWDRHYFDMTDAQRDAIWDALEKFNWYKVRKTQVE